MSSPLQDTVTTRQVIHWLGGYLSPYRWRVAGAVAALLIAAGAWLLLGQGVRFAVDKGFMAENPGTLNTAIVAVLVICLVASLATYCRFYLMTWLGERVSADIRQQVFTHLLTLPPTFYAQTRTGEVISRFTSDSTVLQTVIGMSLSMAIRSAITFIGSLVLMGITSPLLTLCVLLAVPAVLLPIRLLAPRVRRYAKLSQDKVADIGANVDQSLHEIRTVQAYTAESLEADAFGQRVEAAMDTARQRIHYRSLLIGTIMAFSLSAIIVIAWVGARQVFAGSMSMGELSAFLFYAVMAGGSIATISEVIGEVQRGVGASERLLQLLASRSDISAGSQVLPVTNQPPTIDFADILFHYPDSAPLFTNLNLHVAAGETVALVGPSGAGKSTLFHLLLRFYQPQQGQITLNGEPIDRFTLNSLRQQIAIVTQEPVVFATTVMENIRYGNSHASDDDICQAAKAAFAHEFIDQLPQRYHTELGERGVRLSGGQRQRIAIARAILADRPVLLLDEATSALDANSERRVQQALNRLMHGRTTIVIAHRLATVQHADRIVVMDKGKITSTGTHDELIENDMLYREYAELQLLS
ncbi:ABC transporter transmembrane domain-containing protein [Alteromonas sp. ASW11-19]|uniref:ABC transporter transmembrane domain-containing protein n=1 Tax=Alteromonas salexigens TaxID=2982530 RepID=A0ABT2VPH9_9ALTE|nr:ABC transporter transmembrane domain-containing protein [Alteromonas salexigens]MCU7555192.1 ABC transporter transmembrane domain-containing protein [Alteromonas salexigens]